MDEGLEKVDGRHFTRLYEPMLTLRSQAPDNDKRPWSPPMPENAGSIPEDLLSGRFALANLVAVDRHASTPLRASGARAMCLEVDRVFERRKG
jgi:hypothetical protein